MARIKRFAARAMNPSRLLAGAAILIGLYVALDTIGMVIGGYSGLPYWDQWDSLMDYQVWRDGGGTPRLLFAFHNEHRLALPRLVFLADYEWAGGTNKLNLSLISIIQLIHVGLLLSLLAPFRRERSAWVIAAAVLALMMSLGQWQNFTWGFQSQFVGVYALATGAVLLLAKAVGQRGGRRLALFGGVLVLLFLATFTMANGLLTPLAAIALCLAIGAPWWMPVSLAAYFAGATLFYFHGFHAPPGGAGLHGVLADPLRYLLYGLSYLGNPLGDQLLWQAKTEPPRLHLAATLLGAAGAVLAVIVAAWVALRRERDSGQAVLAAVMLLVLLSAALTASGRMQWGLELAYASRYRTTACLFWAAQLIFWFRAADTEGRRRVVVAASVLALAAMLWLQHAVKSDVYADADGRRLAESALLGDVPDMRALEGAFPQSRKVQDRAPLLRAAHKSIFTEPRAEWPGQSLTQVGTPAPGRCAGALDAVVRTSSDVADSFKATGWAWDRKGLRPVRDVVLTDDALHVVGVGRTGVRRPDVGAALHLPWAAGAGWQAVGRVGEGSLHAFGVVGGGAVCALGEFPMAALPPGVVSRPLLMSDRGALLAAPMAGDANWTPDGAPPSVPRLAGAAGFASWSGADAKTGTTGFGPVRLTKAAVAMAVVTGPDATGQSIAVKDARTGETLAVLQPATTLEWAWVRLNLPPTTVGRTVVIEASDAGRGWGQWLGVTAPYDVNRP